MKVTIENKKLVTNDLIESLKTALKFNDWNYTALFLETQGCELVGNKYWKEYRYNTHDISIFWGTDHKRILIRVDNTLIVEVEK